MIVVIANHRPESVVRRLSRQRPSTMLIIIIVDHYPSSLSDIVSSCSGWVQVVVVVIDTGYVVRRSALPIFFGLPLSERMLNQIPSH